MNAVIEEVSPPAVADAEQGPDEAKESDALSQVMERGVRFAMLRLEGVPGNRKVPGTKVLLGEQELDKKQFSDPTRRLLNDAWRKRFGEVKSRAAAIMRRADPRQEEEDGEIVSENLDLMDIPGVALIAAGKMEEVRKDIQELVEKEFEPLVTAFLLDYPVMVEEIRKSIGDDITWSKMVRRIPSVQQLKHALRLRFTQLPITFLTEAGRAVAEQVAKRIILGITKGIEAEADKIRSRVQEQGSFKSATFNGLKEKFQLLKDFNFLASPETLEKLREAEQTFATLGDDAHTVLNQDAKTAEKKIINDVNSALALLTREARKDAGGRFKRSIKF